TIEDSDGIKHYIFTLNGKELKININDFSFEIDFIREIKFIDNFGLSNIEIIKNYSSIQKKDAENILNRFIKNFDPSIEVFKIIDDTPQCKKNGDYLELTEFGDGVRYLVSIVSALYQCENGYLFIDEIDNGIHYTMLAQLWEIILTLANEQNIQVFATTHSKECIESFYQAAKQLEEKEITYTIMTQLKSGAIDAGVYNYDLLENSMEQEHEVRGW
ncbi:AAA family ATPase, partial [Candidatus Venteria ishoeyi]|uniref:AAA family ATPase n=1 Tax=Candidatus Venteria ishoeyi TaxID=1899563 RepID=UPI0025A5F07E